jgi:3D (Asp-Asp-Asp) domain-containing protein
LRAGYGVVAVDPSVIPLRTKVYIPGYGVAIAGDTGGAIKGNIIDLGFDDVRSGWWSSRYTDVYLIE